MFVDQLKRDIHNLDHSIVINHFNTNVKYPMKKVFNEVRRILAEPTNITKRALEVQCLAEPPLTTLEILKDNLEDNWFIKMAEHYHYYSPEVEKIEQRLDKYVEILAICQAACQKILYW
uniref:Uncharacterized protein n=1 Tax=Panagrolaimus sp. PS1159 TaxID=55785 RepID=A0AC35FC08_9BILA